MSSRAAPLDAPAWALLHELRLRGVLADSGDGAAVALVEAGLARRRGERLVLSPEGRAQHAAWAEVADGPARDAAERAYEAFLPLNAELLRICHDWQVLPGGAPNTHTDAKHDHDVIDRLVRLDERAGPVVRRLGRAIDRFAPYRERLRAALRRVEEGEHTWLASPRCDSYHTVWMQLHEDLLLATGRDRVQEGA